jgi:peptide/nickel transport system permease protein
MAEATLSFAGFGFTPPTPSWGAMLQDAGNVYAVVDMPWLLAPAVAILISTVTVQAFASVLHARSDRTIM